MPPIGHHIRARRQSMGLTLVALAQRVGCTKGYLSAIETGRRERPPSARLLARVESSLGFEAGSLVKRAAFDSLPPAARAAARELERRAQDARRLAQLVSDDLHGSPARAEEARRIARALAAGEGTASASIPVLDDEGGAARFVAAPMALPCEAVAVEIRDDAMAPVYVRGDLVVVDPGGEAELPSDCLVRLRSGGGAVFRRVYEDPGSLRLQPLNLRFAPETCVRGAVLSLAPAVCHIRRGVGADAGGWA